MPKILFLTTAHNYNDDRIFYHQANELLTKGFDVKICSLYSAFKGNTDGIEIESFDLLKESSAVKIKKFTEICDSYQPDCIICSEPLAVIAANQFREHKKISIVYDITEWYPSKRMVKNYSFFFKIFHSFKFFLIQLYAGYISDSFIFGEVTKKFPVAYFFPWKPKLLLPYYPDDLYIKKSIKKLEPNEIKLCYTGSFSKEKGIENFFSVADILRKQRPNLKISLIMVGGTRSNDDQLYFSELLAKYMFKNIKILQPVSFDKFTTSYADADICFDLRELNIENDHCLPIKIFYYIASGKPVIYSNLKATRKHMNVFEFGYLVDPQNYDLISKKILDYVDNPQLYNDHAHNARNAFEKTYNWNNIRNFFSTFIIKTLKK